MNARQKAKYYKRRYEELANMPLPKFTVTNYKVDTLHFERYYPECFAHQSQDFISDLLKRDMSDGLAELLLKYVKYTAEFCPHSNQYRVEGEIKVVQR